MKTISFPTKPFFVLAIAFYAGCSTQPPGADSSPALFHDSTPCSHFGPARIDVLPITSIAPASAAGRDATINAYVCLIDTFDSQIKAPVIFRFELFQRLQRSADPKGKRLIVWPDIDLTDPAVNSNLWQDFLRAYLFSLPLQKTSAENCILHVTVICPSGKRLSADFIVRTKS
ncbi:MAG: hypothetical protein WBL85_06410 [Sedimentisphaerales bacterium]